jgi:hypothetical protein
VCPGIIVSATSGKDGFTVKRLIALLVLVAAIITTTIGCGSDTSGTTKQTKVTPTSSGTSETKKNP